MVWKHGVQSCQRNLEVALADVAEIASGYVDDILIGTRRDNPTDSTKDLILTRPGGRVGDGKPAPGKLLAVERWVRPTTITALRGFLGFANY